jgi:hypothetical protein
MIPNRRKKNKEISITLPMVGTLRIILFITTFIFAFRPISRSGRNTRTVRNAFSLLKLDPRNIRLERLISTIKKSRTFHPTRIYDYLPLNTNPETITFNIISIVNREVIITSITKRNWDRSLSGSFSGLSIAKSTEEMIISTSTMLSKCSH